MGRKKESDEEMLARLARRYNKTEILESLETEVLYAEDESARQADAVLLYVEYPQMFMTRTCRVCDRPFATTYRSVAMCSNLCRQRYLRSIGIEWRPSAKPEEQWGKHVPLICPPDALLLVEEALNEGPTTTSA